MNLNCHAALGQWNGVTLHMWDMATRESRHVRRQMKKHFKLMRRAKRGKNPSARLSSKPHGRRWRRWLASWKEIPMFIYSPTAFTTGTVIPAIGLGGPEEKP